MERSGHEREPLDTFSAQKGVLGAGGQSGWGAVGSLAVPCLVPTSLSPTGVVAHFIISSPPRGLWLFKVWSVDQPWWHHLECVAASVPSDPGAPVLSTFISTSPTVHPLLLLVLSWSRGPSQTCFLSFVWEQIRSLKRPFRKCLELLLIAS